jgi:uncharacterized membrane protein
MDSGRADAVRAPAWLAEGVRRLEEDERLDAIAARVQQLARPLDAGRLGEVLRGDWLGHSLHPLLTDLPLGLWLGTGVLDAFGGKRSRPAAQRLLGLGLLLVPPTVASGVVESRRVGEPRSRRVVAAHAAGNGIVATLYLLSWRARRKGRYGRGLTLGLLGGSLAWVTGYLGGHLSFGLGVGTGTRGFSSDVHEDVLDIRDAAELLGVSVEQVVVMVDEEMLVTVTGDASSPYFRRTDILAARLAGG